MTWWNRAGARCTGWRADACSLRIWHSWWFVRPPAVRRYGGRFAPGRQLTIRFIADLVDTLQAAYKIDSARIYANGISNGGGMAYVLSCTMAGRIAAVGMVAPAQALPADWCRSTRPVPVIAFHGTADPMVPYAGGRLGDPFNPVKPVFPAIRDFMASWAARNSCGESPVESTLAPDVSRLEYADCSEGASVVLNTIEGGGHTWPGGKPMPKWYVGRTSASIDATREMWVFFEARSLR